VFANPHKRGKGISTLGQMPEPLFAFAEEICSVLKVRFPGLIGEQVLRVDFFRHAKTGKYYLNEVEGTFNFKI
jgi:hypothetical protein